MTDQRLDAYSPSEIAYLVENLGVKKATLSAIPTATLGLLAGAYIAFGATLFTLVMTDHQMGFGPARLLGGASFSLGLVLVTIGGAELFTGNCLIVTAWADPKVTTLRLLKNL